MNEKYIITNDPIDLEKPSSVYYYQSGFIGRGRYNGANCELSAHKWWLYSACINTADDLLLLDVNVIFKIEKGNVGDEKIKLKMIGGNRSYDLQLPYMGNDTVELVPIGGEQYMIGHVGHTISRESEFIERSLGLINTLEEEKEMAKSIFETLNVEKTKAFNLINQAS